MSNINILHIIDSLPLGGAEKLLLGIVESLNGYNHHLIYLGGSDQLVNQFPPDCKIRKLSKSPTSRWQIPYFAREVNKYIRDNNIEIVHSHLVMATLVAKLACPENVRLFFTLHTLVGSRFFGKGKKALRLLEKKTYKKNHHLIAISEEVLLDYQQYIGIKGPYTILPNFIDEAYFADDYKKSLKKQKLELVAVGNLKPAKNYGYLIEAFKKLPGNVSLDIYGEGPLRDSLQKEIDLHQLQIRLCGGTNKGYELLRNYDLFVMSSSVEGFGLALVEAMASGMPSAVSDLPILRRTTADKGIYFDLGDTDDFCKKIDDIHSGKINLEEYARHNFNCAKTASTKTVYSKSLEAIYGNTKSKTKSVTIRRKMDYKLPVVK